MTPDHSALIERLEVMSGMLTMGERIAFGSDAALMTEAAEAIRDLTAGDVVVVPIEPTNAMLQGACKSHTPGMSMGADRFGRVSGECPSFDRRRRIWADMISRYLPSAPNQAKEAGE